MWPSQPFSNRSGWIITAVSISWWHSTISHTWNEANFNGTFVTMQKTTILNAADSENVLFHSLIDSRRMHCIGCVFPAAAFNWNRLTCFMHFRFQRCLPSHGIDWLRFIYGLSATLRVLWTVNWIIRLVVVLWCQADLLQVVDIYFAMFRKQFSNSFDSSGDDFILKTTSEDCREKKSLWTEITSSYSQKIISRHVTMGQKYQMKNS